MNVLQIIFKSNANYYYFQSHPELIHSLTMEDGLLPLHIAAEKGHRDVVEMMLRFPFTEDSIQIFREIHGSRLYRHGLSVNAKDVRGRTALHVACMSNQLCIVQALLSFKVKAAKMTPSQSNGCQNEQDAAPMSTNVGLNIDYRELESPDAFEATEDVAAKFISAHNPQRTKLHAFDLGEMFNPVDIDCVDLDGNSALHLAVKGDSSPVEGSRGFYEVAEVLLIHGANPNKPLIGASGDSSALLESCLRADVHMMNILLRHKADDHDNKVLAAAVISQHDGMIGTILKYKTYLDLEFKINKQDLLKTVRAEGIEDRGMQESYDASHTAFPSHPVVINWHRLQLPTITKSWLLESAYLHNTNVLSNHKALTLHAITRIDISKNCLVSLPQEIFCLRSLRLLDASQNYLSCLPSKVVSASDTCDESVFEFPSAISCWDCPLLEDVQIQQNKLKTVPPALFKLPSLKRLNMSYNDVDRLPFDMWTASSLTELNVSHNKLCELPCTPDNVRDSLTLGGPGIGSCSENSSLLGSSETLNSTLDESEKHCSAEQNEASAPVTEALPSPSHSTHSNVSLSNVFKEKEISHHAYWRNRLNIRHSMLDDNSDYKKSRLCQLIELNVSHNLFNQVPESLACLAPKLSKLILSHNKLSEIGSLSRYPLGVKLLDLSHNCIMGHLTSDVRGDEQTSGESKSVGKTCFRPVHGTRVKR